MSLLWDHPIKAIIFDNDGTLMDTESVYTICHKALTGIDLDWDFKIQLLGRTPIEACRMTVEHFHLNETPEEHLKRRVEFIYSYWPKVKLMPGAENIISGFEQRNIPMSIATASVLKEFELKSSGHKDLVAKMHHVVCGDQVSHGKPAPDLFLAALQKFDSINPENALVFEDSPLGIKAANAAGIPGIFIPDSHYDAEKCLRDAGAQALLTIPSLEAFPWERFKFE